MLRLAANIMPSIQTGTEPALHWRYIISRLPRSCPAFKRSEEDNGTQAGV